MALAVQHRTSLYERLGGKGAIEAAVKEFYQRVLADRTLAPFFDGIDMKRQMTHLRQFLTMATGGPARYRGRSMSQAHENLAIKQKHFDSVAGHLVAALRHLGVAKTLIGEVVAAVAPLAPQIVNTPARAKGRTQQKNSNGKTSSKKKGRETIMKAGNGKSNSNGKSRRATSGGVAVAEREDSAQEGAELARVRAVIENAPVNIILADTELNITYMNPASLATLKTIEQYLPMPAENVVGSSIDAFHKDPAHQRRLLADPKSLPIKAVISIGPEKADLLVSAMYDDEGEYLGPMVTWQVVTAKLKLETEQARLQAMVENSPTNVILADKDLNIVYMNPASLETLKTLQQYLPVPVDKIVGTNIDAFHKDPAHQRKILSDPKNLPHRANIQIGPETANLLISAIHDEKGNYMGPMATWEVVTEKLKLETEQARLQAMLENSPTNVILADKDLNIVYMNPASLNTLKTLQQYLPVPAEKIVGTNVDAFHKDPAHQRKILSDPKNLPHRANIQIGPETADLLVSAIHDDKGNYMGPMVTWEVITEKLKMEQEIKDNADRERERAEDITEKVRQMTAIVETLASSSEELSSVSQQMSGTAEETSAQANVVSAAAEEVSKNIATVATGSEEMSASIREIAKNASDAAKVATGAVKTAETTNETVAKLGESSADIGKVIKVITSIAQQTNLLALNATIEAARAGEAGKGFAVVANEVKELAKETAKATEDISQKIEAIQGDSQSAVTAIAEITQVINQINDISNTIASAVEEQTATTNEIGRNVAEAAKGSSEIAENISGVAKAAQDTTQGAGNTQTAATDLSRMAAELQTLVSQLQ